MKGYSRKSNINSILMVIFCTILLFSVFFLKIYHKLLYFLFLIFFLPDPAKRMNGAYGYIGYFGVILLSISVALQLLGVF